MVSLRRLYLDGNSLTQLPPWGFKPLVKATHLSLRYNQISKIDTNAFVGLYNLELLWLSHNAVTQLTSVSVFRDLHNCTRLDLSHNQISNINEHAFVGLKSLQWLYLSDTHLSFLATGIFFPLTQLKELDLQQNQISKLQKNAFLGLDNLEKLNLNNNSLTFIPGGIFALLTQCTKLILENNFIKDIENGAFSGLFKLQDLGIGGNVLKTLNFSAFKDLPRPLNLYLYLSPTDKKLMGESMCWLKKEVTDKTIKFSVSLAYISGNWKAVTCLKQGKNRSWNCFRHTMRKVLILI